jgi:uncharacterized protein YdaU (DUF1376 family)
MANEAPAFQLYVKDFLSDPFVDVMTPEELGGYFRLILIAWQQSNPGYLPGDDRLLADWSKLKHRWKACRTAILRCFKELPDGRIYQKRMVEIAAEMAARRRDRVEAGRAGGRAKWAVLSGQVIETPPTGPSNAIGLLVAKPSSSSASASSSASDSGSDPRSSGSETLPGAASPRAPALFDPGPPRLRFDFDRLYDGYPRKKGKAEGMKACAKLIRTQADYDLAETAIAALATRVRVGQQDPDYVPYFSSFINQRRWLDEPDQVKPLALVNGRSEPAPAPEYHPPWLPKDSHE